MSEQDAGATDRSHPFLAMVMIAMTLAGFFGLFFDGDPFISGGLIGLGISIGLAGVIHQQVRVNAE